MSDKKAEEPVFAGLELRLMALIEKLRTKSNNPAQTLEEARAMLPKIEEDLDRCRISDKYIVFDLEATRRENGFLRKMLEDSNGGQ